MKKLVATIMLLSLSLSLIGCGGEAQKNEPQKVETAGEATDKPQFKNNVLELPDFKIEITQTKVIPVGQKGNEYGEKPVIAFWYKTTNKTDKELDPSIAWIGSFTAIQDNDKNAVNELNVASLPDEKYLDSQTQKIKKGGTVENAMAYELTDNTTPIKLVAKNDLLGGVIGEQEYQIK